MARKKNEMKAKEPVKLRFKKLSNANQSIYLDIYYKGKRYYEFLKLYLTPERFPEDRDKNRITLRLANSIKAQRIIDLQNEIYGVRMINGLGKKTLLEFLSELSTDKSAHGDKAYSLRLRSLANLSLDMTQVKVNNIQKYKSGTIKFVPKDVFVLHGRKKADVADQSINNNLWFNLPNRVWGNIAATYETANRDDYYSGTNASSSFGRFAGTVDATNYIKALSTTTKTYTQDWTGATISGDKEIALANSLYFYVLPNDQTKAAREQEDPEEEGPAFVLDKTTLASELVISGEVYIKAIMNDNTSWTFGEESTPVLRYWPIKIGIDGLDSEDTYYGQVHRNVVYNISATIAGNGYADPTLPKGDPTADLFVKTMVMNWGTATQAPVIE